MGIIGELLWKIVMGPVMVFTCIGILCLALYYVVQLALNSITEKYGSVSETKADFSGEEEEEEEDYKQSSPNTTMHRVLANSINDTSMQ